jgi:hypothetical protein
MGLVGVQVPLRARIRQVKCGKPAAQLAANADTLRHNIPRGFDVQVASCSGYGRHAGRTGRRWRPRSRACARAFVSSPPGPGTDHL